MLGYILALSELSVLCLNPNPDKCNNPSHPCEERDLFLFDMQNQLTTDPPLPQNTDTLIVISS